MNPAQPTMPAASGTLAMPPLHQHEQLMPMAVAAQQPMPIAAVHVATASQVQTPQMLASELAPLTVGELRKRAAAAGVAPNLIEDARDADQPKQELTALIMAIHGARLGM